MDAQRREIEHAVRGMQQHQPLHRHHDDEEEDEYADEEVDPRVEGTLDTLNRAPDDINRLEKDLDAARAHHRKVGEETERQLRVLVTKYRKSAEKAKPYYAKLFTAQRFRERATVLAQTYHETQNRLSSTRAQLQVFEKDRTVANLGESAQAELNALNEEVDKLQAQRHHVSVEYDKCVEFV
jgi:hypothetical protein